MLIPAKYPGPDRVQVTIFLTQANFTIVIRFFHCIMYISKDFHYIANSVPFPTDETLKCNSLSLLLNLLSGSGYRLTSTSSFLSNFWLTSCRICWLWWSRMHPVHLNFTVCSCTGSGLLVVCESLVLQLSIEGLSALMSSDDVSDTWSISSNRTHSQMTNTACDGSFNGVVSTHWTNSVSYTIRDVLCYKQIGVHNL